MPITHVVRGHGPVLEILLISRIHTYHSLLVTYVAQNRKKAGPDFLWISWALGPQSRPDPHFGHIGKCEKLPQMTIFEGKMKEKL